ncbi:hypothetical protein ACVILI_006502 [Mesorhizobium sp. USDA 4775]|uniref:Uncharacterized protein n=1 Tax=Mesorhizobium qingshengii TaxID=1165689 RepID=A0A1G5ZZ83_9HYPH|nr:hypothetical protein SAMN02927914_06839 [Mesorhizobium qingshengii]
MRDEGTFERLDLSCREYGAGAGMDHPLLIAGVNLLATGNDQ